MYKYHGFSCLFVVPTSGYCENTFLGRGLFNKDHSLAVSKRKVCFNGFTLIELLVVISIIALLIGILLPVLAGVRKAGQIAACASQERQIGTAFFTYATDNNSILPYGYERLSGGRVNTWDDALHTYLNGTASLAEREAPILEASKALEVLICPADPTANLPRNIGGVDGMARSYSVVGNASVAFDPDQVFDLIELPSSLPPRPRRSLRSPDLASPSDTLMLTEVTTQEESIVGGPPLFDFYNTQGARLNWALVSSPAIQATNSTFGVTTDWHPLAHTNDRDKPEFNYLFLDGHVEFLELAETGVEDSWLMGAGSVATYSPRGAWSIQPRD
ncbi:MAG: prepilin-type N-terminal cleavage/methylation domain-containing protein [Planctomycetota bacterium]